jgi:hypothetical protein
LQESPDAALTKETPRTVILLGFEIRVQQRRVGVVGELVCSPGALEYECRFPEPACIRARTDERGVRAAVDMAGRARLIEELPGTLESAGSCVGVQQRRVRAGVHSARCAGFGEYPFRLAQLACLSVRVEKRGVRPGPELAALTRNLERRACSPQFARLAVRVDHRGKGERRRTTVDQRLLEDPLRASPVAAPPVRADEGRINCGCRQACVASPGQYRLGARTVAEGKVALRHLADQICIDRPQAERPIEEVEGDRRPPALPKQDRHPTHRAHQVRSVHRRPLKRVNPTPHVVR